MTSARPKKNFLRDHSPILILAGIIILVFFLTPRDTGRVLDEGRADSLINSCLRAGGARAIAIASARGGELVNENQTGAITAAAESAISRATEAALPACYSNAFSGNPAADITPHVTTRISASAVTLTLDQSVMINGHAKTLRSTQSIETPLQEVIHQASLLNHDVEATSILNSHLNATILATSAGGKGYVLLEFGIPGIKGPGKWWQRIS